MADVAIITEACIDVKDRACLEVCPAHCIYEFDPNLNVLFADGDVDLDERDEPAAVHTPDPGAIQVFSDSILYVNVDECISCAACYQPDVCPVGAIYPEGDLPDGSPESARYNPKDTHKGHDHTYFAQHSRDVFFASDCGTWT